MCNEDVLFAVLSYDQRVRFEDISYRLWYLMLFFILWILKLWIRRLQSVLLFPLFWSSEVLSITEDWMWFDYCRLLCVTIIDKHWQSKTKKLWGRTQLARLMWYVWHDHTYKLRAHKVFICLWIGLVTSEGITREWELDEDCFENSSLICNFLALCNRTSQKVNEMLGNINTSSALAAFEKMEEKGTVYRTAVFTSQV